MEFCGIKLDLSNWIPLERWLQMFALCYYVIGATCYGLTFLLTSALLIYYQFHQLYVFPILYIAWIIYDYNICKHGARPRDWFRRAKLWIYFRDYFPVRMIKTCELTPSKNYILAYHPHGLLCCGVTACFGTDSTNFSEAFPGITPRVLLINNALMAPISREHLLWAGACSVSKESFDWLLTKKGTGNALVVVVGGVKEAMATQPGSATLILKNRKGFVKMALKHGASLVPVFAFGENELFIRVSDPEGSRVRRFQNKFRKIFGFEIPLHYGRGIFPFKFGLLPFRKPITVVIGKPIDLEADPESSQEKIDATHQMYMDSLTELFEEHKAIYGPDLQLKLK